MILNVTSVVLLRGAVAYQDMMRKGQEAGYVYAFMTFHQSSI